MFKSILALLGDCASLDCYGDKKNEKEQNDTIKYVKQALNTSKKGSSYGGITTGRDTDCSMDFMDPEDDKKSPRTCPDNK